MLIKLYKSLPPFVRLNLKRYLRNSLDFFPSLFRSGEPLVPRKGDQLLIGDGDFEKVGKEFFRYFVEWGGLKPNQEVLDIGCGFGRMALPLIPYLVNGKYEGFDIQKVGIHWCQQNIALNHPQFVFTHVDVFNPNYNPKGKLLAHSFSFPYESDRFDFAFATSLFTHLQVREAQNYLKELGRVLAPGGTFLATFFIINVPTQRLMTWGKSQLIFQKVNDEGLYAVDPVNPEQASGFEESRLNQWLNKSGLKVTATLPGSWSGAPQSKSFQDMVLGTKPSP